MFRKIVSNLPFSPALIGQLGFYARRLRKEEATRKLGLIVTVLALIVQSFAVFIPPEAANASSSADFVRGGVTSVSNFLSYYDRNYNHIKDIYNSLHITRAEIAAAKYTVIGESSRYNWSLTSLYSAAQGQRSWRYGGGPNDIVYYRPMRLTQEGGDHHPVFASTSKAQGWFAIKIDCGNLITENPPHAPAASCSNLTVVALSETRFRFTGKASPQYGATISGYTYVVYNSAGSFVSKIDNSSSETTNSVLYTQSKPDTYRVSLIVHTSVGDIKSDTNCQAKFTVALVPAAECLAVGANIVDRNIVNLTGSSMTHNGATVSKYIFVIKDDKGSVVKTVAVTSTEQMVSAPSFTLPEGAYTVELVVTTSIGIVRDGKDCIKQFVISPPGVCTYNPSLPVDSPGCQPCPDNPEIWIKDDRCSADIIDSKTATNITQGAVSASKKIAKTNDRISYTVTVENRGYAAQDVTIKENLADVLQYANLIDTGGGTFDKKTNILEWPLARIGAKSTQSRTFVVQVLPTIPLTNTGTSDQSSYDCVMTNTFGNSIDVVVNCAPIKKIVERTVGELPHTGPGENMIFAGSLFAVVSYFYARSRQLGKEVRLIRRNVSTGTI